MAAPNPTAYATDDDTVWKCVYCLNPEGECSCTDADFYEDEGRPRLKNVTCPDCDSDTNVHCCECGERPTACHCPIEDVTDWFCMSCQDVFYWDPFIGAAETLDDRSTMIVADSDEPDFEVGEDGSVVVETSDGTQLIYTIDGMIFWKDTGEELTCKCNPTKVYACAPCKVRRETTKDKWTYWDLKKKPTETTTYKSQITSNVKTYDTKPTPKAAYGYPGYGGMTWGDDDEYDWTTWKTCRHYDREVLLKTTTVWASSLNDNYDGKRTTKPDFGLYADWSWHPAWRNEHIAWPDFSVPTNLHVAAEQIIDAYTKAVDGVHVEVGCIGGHGRTGTIIACMAVLDGMTADDAIWHVRDTYCKQAIESAEQEWFVEWFEAISLGKKPPRRPKAKAKYVVTKTATTTAGVQITSNNTYCSTREHWDAWLSGAMICPSHEDKCKFWFQDVHKFENGQIDFGSPSVATTPPAPKEGVRQPKPEFVVINGFKVPKPKRGETQHDPTAKRGCKCDFCRYTDLSAWGVGRAFLEQLDSTDTEDAEYVNVSGPAGEIIRVKVQRSELDKPENRGWATTGKVNGIQSDEYEWDPALGWQWKGKAVAAPLPKQTKRKKNKKKSKANGYTNRR